MTCVLPSPIRIPRRNRTTFFGFDWLSNRASDSTRSGQIELCGFDFTNLGHQQARDTIVLGDQLQRRVLLLGRKLQFMRGDIMILLLDGRLCLQQPQSHLKSRVAHLVGYGQTLVNAHYRVSDGFLSQECLDACRITPEFWVRRIGKLCGKDAIAQLFTVFEVTPRKRELRQTIQDIFATAQADRALGQRSTKQPMSVFNLPLAQSNMAEINKGCKLSPLMTRSCGDS